jgi:sugar phosphate isomerase/epimerase
MARHGHVRADGIRRTKEIGFDAYDVFEDPLLTSPEEQRAISELAEYAEPSGIEIVIELEPFEHAIASSVHELARLIRDVDHPAVKANADVSDLHLSGASSMDVNVLAGLIGHVHVSVRDPAAWQPVSST